MPRNNNQLHSSLLRPLASQCRRNYVLTKFGRHNNGQKKNSNHHTEQTRVASLVSNDAGNFYHRPQFVSDRVAVTTGTCWVCLLASGLRRRRCNRLGRSHL